MVFGHYQFEIIAETGDRFRNFAPYVPAIDDEGRVAFTAETADNRRCVFIDERGKITSYEQITTACSHPDINGSGDVCVYVEKPKTALWSNRSIADEAFDEVGPLGPTINRGGNIAFRATRNGAPGIFALMGETIVEIALGRGEYQCFHGIPVINDHNEVVYRADRTDGSEVIVKWRGDRQHLIADTRKNPGSLNKFPSLNNHGEVACTSEDSLFISDNKSVKKQIRVEGTLRGALIDDNSHILYFATPRNAPLTIFDELHRPLLAIGDEFQNGTIDEFALNSASINRRGDFALRIMLTDGRQFIVCARIE